MDENAKQNFDASLSRFLDGEPDPGDGERISEAARNNPKLGRDVTGLLMVDQLLRQNAEPHADAFLDALQTRLAAEQESASFMERMESAVQARRPSSTRSVLPWLAAAAACLIAVLSWWRPGADHPGPDSSSGVVAVLVDQAGARYGEGHGPDHGRFSVGTVELLEGTAHLRLTNGIDIVAPAPVRFELRDSRELTLEAGRLRVMVPEQGHGFTVKTPAATFEDLGTEFGISVDSDSGASELHVFQGRVDIKEKQGADRLASVVVGESVRVVRGKVTPADPPDTSTFPTPDTIGTRRWNRARERIRHDPDLVFYYPFIREAGTSLLRDHAENGANVDGVILGARWVTGRWAGKQALLFDREDDAVSLEVPGSYETFTIAGWIKVERLDYELNALFDSDGWERGDVHWQLNRRGQQFFGVFDDTVRVSHEGTELLQGEWTHLAVTLDVRAHHAACYVNGKRDSVYRLGEEASYVPGASRIGNWLRRPDYKHVLKRGFAGRIDELAMWRRVLTQDEISGLVEEGRPAVLWGALTGSPEKR